MMIELIGIRVNNSIDVSTNTSFSVGRMISSLSGLYFTILNLLIVLFV